MEANILRRKLESITYFKQLRKELERGGTLSAYQANRRITDINGVINKIKEPDVSILQQASILKDIYRQYAGKNLPIESPTVVSITEKSVEPRLLSVIPSNAKAGISSVAGGAATGGATAGAHNLVESTPVVVGDMATTETLPTPIESIGVKSPPCVVFIDPCTGEPLADFAALERRVRELKQKLDSTPVGLYGVSNSMSTWDFLTTVFVNKSISLDDMVSFKITGGSQAGADIFEVLCRLFVVFGGVSDINILKGAFQFLQKLEGEQKLYETVEAALKGIKCKATSATGVSDITLFRAGPVGSGSRISESYCESTAVVDDSIKTYAMSVKWYKNEKNAEHYDLEKLYTALGEAVAPANKPAAIIVFLKSKTDFEIAHNRAYRQYVRGLSKHFYGWIEDVKPFLQSFRHSIFEAAEQRGQTPVDTLQSLYFIPTAKPVLSLQLHQEIIVQKINNAMEIAEDNRYLIGVLPRGGKTYIAGGIVREYMRRRRSGRENLTVLWLTAAPTETFSQVGADLVQKFEDFKDFDFIYVKDEGGDVIPSTKPNKFIFCSTQLLTQIKAGLARKRKIIEELLSGATRTSLVFYDEAHKTGVGEKTKEDIDKIIEKYSSSKMPFIFLTATYFNILFEYKILREHTFLWDYTDVLRTRGLATDSDQASALENLKVRFGKELVDTILTRRIGADDSYDAMAKAYIGFPDLYFISADFQQEALARFATQNQYRPESGFKLDSIFAINPHSSTIDVLTTGNSVRADAWKIFNNIINPRNIVSLLTPSATGFIDTLEGGTPLTKEARDSLEPSILGRIHELSRSAESRFRLDENPTLLMFLPTHGGEGSSISRLQCAWAALLKSHPWWAARYDIICVVDSQKLTADEIRIQTTAGAPDVAEGIYIVSSNPKQSIIDLEKNAHAHGKGVIVLAGDKLSMGVSLPCTDVVFLFNSTKSPDDIIQKMYRALTPSPGKKAAFVVDLNPVRTLAATYGYIRAATQDSKTPSELLKIIYDTYSWDADVFEYSLTKGTATRPLRFQERLNELFNTAEQDKRAGYRIDEDFGDLEKRLNTNLRRGLSQSLIRSLSRVFTERPTGTELQISLTDGAKASVKGGKLVIRIPKEAPPRAPVGGAGLNEDSPAPVSYDEIVIDNIIEIVSDFIKYLAITTTKSTLLEAVNEYQTNADYKRNVVQLLQNRFTLTGVPQDTLDTILIEATKNIASHVSEDMFKHMKRKIDDTEIRRNAVLKMIHHRITPRKKQKEERGEVFTPIELIESMLSHLPASVWSDHTQTWLDPANGIGNFPVVVFGKLDEGLKSWEPNDKKRRRHILEKMLYMIEIQSDNSRVAHRIFSKMCDGCTPNIWTVDTLTISPDKLSGKGWPTKFDVIMGNPPFQSDGVSKGGGALWPKFVDFAFNHVKEGGYITYIHPPGWRKYYDPSERDNQGRLWYTIREKGWHLDYVNISDRPPTHFPIVDYYVIHAKASTKPTRYNSEFMGIKSAGESIIDYPFIPNMLNDETMSILRKIFSVGGTPINIIRNQSFKPSIIDKDNKGIPHYHFTDKAGEKQLYKKEYETVPEYISKDKVIMTFKAGYEKGRLFAFYNEGIMGTTANGMYMLTSSKVQGEKLAKFFNSDVITFLMKITQYSASPNHINELKILNTIKMPESMEDYGLTAKENELISTVVGARHEGGFRHIRKTRKRGRLY